MEQATDIRATSSKPVWLWSALGIVVVLIAVTAWRGFGPAGVPAPKAASDVDPGIETETAAAYSPLPRPFPPGVTAAASVLAVRDGTHVVASAGADGMIRVSVEGNQLITAVAHHGLPVTAMAISSDGRTVLSGGGDSELRVWDVKSGTERLNLRGHEHPITKRY